METLRRQISRAHRRLILQSFIGKLAWCWFVTLLAAAVAIGVGKLWPPLTDPRAWALGSLAVALAVGVLAAGVWTWMSRQNALEAAVEIDRRFGLKERVSSTLVLDPAQLQSDIGQALVRDAVERLDRIDVAEHFGLRFDRRALLPLAPAAVAFVLAMFVSERVEQKPAQASAAESAQIKKPVQALVKKLDQQRKDAEAKGLADAGDLLKQLEPAMKNLAEKNQADRKQTLVALNDIVKEAEKRREKLAGSADMKQQLNQLKNLQPGPADKLASALKKADLDKAIKELDNLQEKLNGDKLSEPEKKELAKQLTQMHEALDKHVQANKEAQEELRKQVEAQRKAGNVAEADKLQQQLEKLAQKDPQMEKLAKMAQQLKKASQCMNENDCKQAAAAMSKLGSDLAAMKQELAELESLDKTLDEVSDCKNAMACKECQGDGCAACQGDKFAMNQEWKRSKNAKGGGIGAGEREERENQTSFYDSQVKQNVGKGSAVATGLADGPNRKGKAQEEIKGSFSSAEQQTAEALSDQRLPHDYRDHAKKYFDALREGQK